MRTIVRLVRGFVRCVIAVLGAPLLLLPASWRPRPTIRALLVGVLLLVAEGRARPPLRIATFNAANYGEIGRSGRPRETDEARLAALLAEVDADLIALQEIHDLWRLRRVVAASGGERRRYEVRASGCSPPQGRVAIVYDALRLRLVGGEEYPVSSPRVACAPRQFARFDGPRGPFEVLAVHFKAFDDSFEIRRQEWTEVLAFAARRRAEGGPPIAILGDVNSTGFLNQPAEERRFMISALRDAGLRLPTRDIDCSAYYQPDRNRRGAYHASLLDHIAISDDFPIRVAARVHGYCAELGCPAQVGAPPADFQTVSDHCPVSVGN